MAESLGSDTGELRRFILERFPVRGFWLRLDSAWRALRSFNHYPPEVEALLGEAVTASALLAATLKFEGTLTLQITGDGLVKLLVAQCTHEFDIRAVARTETSIVSGASFRELIGGGRLTVTVEAEERSARYQGIVELRGDTLAACLENYFATSEQLPTRVVLYADAARTGGLLLQKLPAAQAQGEALAAVSQDVWEQLQTRMGSLEPSLLQLGTAEHALQRVCGEYDCRLFAPTPVRFACRCSQQRVRALLRALGADEVRSVLAEQGSVTVTCDFCGRPYPFDAIDVERLFADNASPDAPHSLN